MFGAELGSARERRLLRLLRALNNSDREALYAFAEFLETRARAAAADPGGAVESRTASSVAEPCFEPRPAGESVIAAIRRLRRTFPMLDAAELLNQVAVLMSAHVLQGRPAVEVIDELETVFDTHWRQFRHSSR